MSLLKARSCYSSKSILQKALQGGKPPYNCGLLPVVKALSDRTQLLQANVLKFCIQLAEALSHIFPNEIQKMSNIGQQVKEADIFQTLKIKHFVNAIFIHTYK